jgi:hypothetical protein
MRYSSIRGRGTIDVPQMPGWETYMRGFVDFSGRSGLPRYWSTWLEAEGKVEVMAKISVRRFDDSYGTEDDNHWMTLTSNVCSYASMLLIHIIRPLLSSPGRCFASKGAR